MNTLSDDAAGADPNKRYSSTTGKACSVGSKAGRSVAETLWVCSPQFAAWLAAQGIAVTPLTPSPEETAER